MLKTNLLGRALNVHVDPAVSFESVTTTKAASGRKRSVGGEGASPRSPEASPRS